MKKGDRVIIAGPNGYEIGFITYINQILMLNAITVEFSSGPLVGARASFDIGSLHLYEDRMIDNLTEKHGYEKRFAKEF